MTAPRPTHPPTDRPTLNRPSDVLALIHPWRTPAPAAPAPPVSRPASAGISPSHPDRRAGVPTPADRPRLATEGSMSTQPGRDARPAFHELFPPGRTSASVRLNPVRPWPMAAPAAAPTTAAPPGIRPAPAATSPQPDVVLGPAHCPTDRRRPNSLTGSSTPVGRTPEPVKWVTTRLDRDLRSTHATPPTHRHPARNADPITDHPSRPPRPPIAGGETTSAQTAPAQTQRVMS